MHNMPQQLLHQNPQQNLQANLQPLPVPINQAYPVMQNPGQMPHVPQAGQPQMAVQNQGQGGPLTDITSLTTQEKKLLKEIMEHKNKKDPRCAQKIKEILQKHPRIKEFILNQNKVQHPTQQ